MAIGKSDLGELHSVEGIKMATVSAGIKTPGRLDTVLFEICDGASVAGIFTQNAFCAAPVVISKNHSQLQTPRYFLINTGNANAGTGEKGLASALSCCQAVANDANVDLSQVLPFSTGVIGEALPENKIINAIPELLSSLNSKQWLEAASGIMTTDTRPKAFSKQITLAGKTITITGIAKGAGMIKPNMATMLAYVFTDIAIDQSELQLLLQLAADKSLNRITVDGDTSTNDCCMLVATGSSKLKLSDISISQEEKQAYTQALQEVFNKLAQGLIKDAEGASKFVNIKVESGASTEECLQIAYVVAESPLVKTALFASDPNWGRILAAIGRGGIKNLEIDKIEVYLGEVCIVSNGCVSESYQEALGQKEMDKDEIIITINLGRGVAFEEVWTSDLSYDYIKINAEYRT